MPVTAEREAATVGESPALSLVRKDAGSELLRRRIERPAIIGQYVLGTLGAVAAAAGIGLWFTDHSTLGLAMGAFGGLLVALGVVQALILRRDRAHWPEEVILWDGGIELVLHNREVRGVSWDDPQLALNLVARPAPAPAGHEYLLVWMSEGKIPSAELSAEGFARLRRTAERRQLRVVEPHPSRRPEGPTWWEIRPNAAGRPAVSGAPSGDAAAP